MHVVALGVVRQLFLEFSQAGHLDGTGSAAAREHEVGDPDPTQQAVAAEGVPFLVGERDEGRTPEDPVHAAVARTGRGRARA